MQKSASAVKPKRKYPDRNCDVLIYKSLWWTKGPISPHSSLYSKQHPEQATSSVYSVGFSCIYSCVHFSPSKSGSQVLTNKKVTLEVSFLLAYFLEKVHLGIRKVPVMASVRTVVVVLSHTTSLSSSEILFLLNHIAKNTL